MEPEVSQGTNRGLNLGIIILGALAIVFMISFFNRINSPRPDPTRVFNPTGLLGNIIQVDVRNGNGKSGLARDITEHLVSYGFDVIEHGDYSSFDVDSTVVIDRIGNMDAANQVALALGVPRIRVISDVQPELYLDVSVIIGKDYMSIHPFREGR